MTADMWSCLRSAIVHGWLHGDRAPVARNVRAKGASVHGRHRGGGRARRAVRTNRGSRLTARPLIHLGCSKGAAHAGPLSETGRRCRAQWRQAASRGKQLQPPPGAARASTRRCTRNGVYKTACAASPSWACECTALIGDSLINRDSSISPSTRRASTQQRYVGRARPAPAGVVVER